jgi:Zn-dependent alcohol dehydrogenase
MVSRWWREESIHGSNARVPAKSELARAFGRTDVIDPKAGAFKQALFIIGGIGVDYAFEVVGSGKLSEG